MKEGDIVLLENVRFHKEEEQNDPEYSKALASMAEIYVMMRSEQLIGRIAQQLELQIICQQYQDS